MFIRVDILETKTGLGHPAIVNTDCIAVLRLDGMTQGIPPIPCGIVTMQSGDGFLVPAESVTKLLLSMNLHTEGARP